MIPSVLTPSSQASSISSARPISLALNALALGDLDQPHRVRALGRSDHQHRLAGAGDVLDRRLAVRGRVADVLALGPAYAGEAALQGRDDLGGVVDRERGLGEIGEAGGLGRRDPLRILDALDQGHPPFRHLAEGPDHLGMAANGR